MSECAKSLQATRDGGSSSASRFTAFGPACLSSGRWSQLRQLSGQNVERVDEFQPGD
jgi:hypothetical protein